MLTESDLQVGKKLLLTDHYGNEHVCVIRPSSGVGHIGFPCIDVRIEGKDVDCVLPVAALLGNGFASAEPYSDEPNSVVVEPRYRLDVVSPRESSPQEILDWLSIKPRVLEFDLPQSDRYVIRFHGFKIAVIHRDDEGPYIFRGVRVAWEHVHSQFDGDGTC
jgi:hypothetical protein